MTNPHPTTATDIDIRRSADQVITQFRQGHDAEAMRLLAQARSNERPVVQEALDRYVSAGARPQLDQLNASGALQGADDQAALQRLRQASQPPRMPEYSQVANQPNELVGLTEAQKYDIYASMVETRGNQHARDALGTQDSVLLGLRRETSTIASMDDNGQRGTGVYDDQIAVLRKDADGGRHWFLADRASTEPTAQYDQHARPAPGRENTPYADVTWRRAEGEDVNGDRVADLGRMAEGTIEMSSTIHTNPRAAGTNRAFRPSTEQLTAPRDADLVQRDTNGDGLFNQDDTNGVQDLNRTFKIHSGSRTNTDSAGCQTIHPSDFSSFIDAAEANPGQTRWQYVLTSTAEPPAPLQEQGREQAPPQQQAPAAAPAGGERHGMNQPGPFNDTAADHYLAAAMSGDSDAMDRLALNYAQSNEGQRMAQMGDDLLAQHQAMDRQVAQQQQHAPQEHLRQ